MTEKISIKFNEDDLTIGDLEDFEDVVGETIFDALKAKPVIGYDGRPERDDDGRPIQEMNVSARALKALVWITLRKERDGFSLEDARNIKVTHLELDGGDDESPEGKEEPISEPLF